MNKLPKLRSLFPIIGMKLRIAVVDAPPIGSLRLMNHGETSTLRKRRERPARWPGSMERVTVS